MKPKKQKRIRAVKLWSFTPPPRAVARWQSLVTWSGMHPKSLADQKPYYVIAGEDVPALIEQLAEDLRRAPFTSDVGLLTHILKRAGITGPAKKSKS